jgi:hypothetical protein
VRSSPKARHLLVELLEDRRLLSLGSALLAPLNTVAAPVSASAGVSLVSTDAQLSLQPSIAAVPSLTGSVGTPGLQDAVKLDVNTKAGGSSPAANLNLGIRTDVVQLTSLVPDGRAQIAIEGNVDRSAGLRVIMDTGTASTATAQAAATLTTLNSEKAVEAALTGTGAEPSATRAENAVVISSGTSASQASLIGVARPADVSAGLAQILLASPATSTRINSGQALQDLATEFNRLDQQARLSGASTTDEGSGSGAMLENDEEILEQGVQALAGANKPDLSGLERDMQQLVAQLQEGAAAVVHTGFWPWVVALATAALVLEVVRRRRRAHKRLLTLLAISQVVVPLSSPNLSSLDESDR